MAFSKYYTGYSPTQSRRVQQDHSKVFENLLMNRAAQKERTDSNLAGLSTGLDGLGDYLNRKQSGKNAAALITAPDAFSRGADYGNTGYVTGGMFQQGAEPIGGMFGGGGLGGFNQMGAMPTGGAESGGFMAKLLSTLKNRQGTGGADMAKLFMSGGF